MPKQKTITKERADLYKTILGSEPSDAVKIENNAPPQLESKTVALIDNITTLFKMGLSIIPIFGFIAATIITATTVFKSRLSIITFPDFSILAHLCVRFLFTELKLFVIFMVFEFVILIGVSLIQFIVYCVLDMHNSKVIDKTAKEVDKTTEVIANELKKQDKADSEKK